MFCAVLCSNDASYEGCFCIQIILFDFPFTRSVAVHVQVTQMVSDQGGVPRLGVPPFGHTECTHGTLNDGTILTTLFPQALSVARRSECSLS